MAKGRKFAAVAKAPVKKKSSAARRKELSKWQPPPAKEPNIFMTLPPELRNAVYEAALPQDQLIGIKCEHQRAKRGLFSVENIIGLETTPKAKGERKNRWQEPPLLQGNDFDILIRLQNMDDLCAYLRRMVERCGVSPFRTLHIRLPHLGGSCDELPCGYELAKVFWQTGLQVVPGSRSKAHPSKSYDDGLLLHSWAGERKIDAAMNTVIELGKRAAREGWDEKMLNGRLKKWLSMFMSLGEMSPLIVSGAWKVIAEA